MLIVVVILIVALVLSLVLWRVLEVGKNKVQPATPKGDSSQKAESKEYVTIREWGIRFKVPEALQGAEHFKPLHTTGDSFTFTTPALAASAYECRQVSGNIVLGLLTRSTQQDPQWGESIAKIGNYYFLYRAPQSACSGDSALESKTVQALREALWSIEVVR
jgi:hypothetical protein